MTADSQMQVDTREGTTESIYNGWIRCKLKVLSSLLRLATVDINVFKASNCEYPNVTRYPRKMRNMKKNIKEGLLIVFSVLFALFINKSFDDYKTNKKKKIAIESIQQELYRNSQILRNWKEKHIKIRNRITEIVEGRNDSLKTDLLKYKFLNLGVLTNNESLIDAILISTAWESAKSTGIIAEFDFETTQKLTQIYSMQEVLTERTLVKILDYYFDTNAHNMENIDQILIQFQLRFGELTGQEELMTGLYSEAIDQIK